MVLLASFYTHLRCVVHQAGVGVVKAFILVCVHCAHVTRVGVFGHVFIKFHVAEVAWGSVRARTGSLETTVPLGTLLF